MDLAGSERTERSGATGERMKEACAINKSLSCLSDVFHAISNNQKHIPYRNSKLTHLLAPCLGGDGKTLMFVNVSPEATSAEETLCSLRFASQVNSCELGNRGGGGGGVKRNVQSIAPGAAKVRLDMCGASGTPVHPLARRLAFLHPKSQASSRPWEGEPLAREMASKNGRDNSWPHNDS